MIKLVDLFRDKSLVRDFEKVSFAVDCLKERLTFNISEGTWDLAQEIRNYFLEDELRTSPLWRGGRSLEEFRLEVWQEIKHNLPIYLERGKSKAGSSYFPHLMELAELVAAGKDIELIYISDLAHAEMISRCVTWLAEQITW